MAYWIITPCNVARSWHWICQVTAPCNVACGSGIMTVNSRSGSTLQCDTWLWMTCHWILPVAAPGNVTHSSGIMTLNSPGGSTLQRGRWLWDDMPWNSPKRTVLEFYIWFRFWPYHRSRHVILHQSAKFYPNTSTFSRKKWRHIDFSRWRITAIFDFRGPIMGSLKIPCTISHRSSIDTIALNCLVFEKIAFLYFGDRRTDGQARCMKSRAAAS